MGRFALLATFVAMLPALGGCQATLSTQDQPDEAPVANAELMEYISNLSYVTADAGFRAVIENILSASPMRPR